MGDEIELGSKEFWEAVFDKAETLNTQEKVALFNAAEARVNDGVADSEHVDVKLILGDYHGSQGLWGESNGESSNEDNYYDNFVDKSIWNNYSNKEEIFDKVFYNWGSHYATRYAPSRWDEPESDKGFSNWGGLQHNKLLKGIYSPDKMKDYKVKELLIEDINKAIDTVDPWGPNFLYKKWFSPHNYTLSGFKTFGDYELNTLKAAIRDLYKIPNAWTERKKIAEEGAADYMKAYKKNKQEIFKALDVIDTQEEFEAYQYLYPFLKGYHQEQQRKEAE